MVTQKYPSYTGYPSYTYIDLTYMTLFAATFKGIRQHFLPLLSFTLSSTELPA